MRKLGKAIGAIVMVGTIAAGSQAQHHARDSRQYFDYGDPLMSSIIQSPDGKTVDVRVNTASSMFSFLRAQNGFYAIRDLTITVNEEGNSEPLATRDRIDTIF